MPFARLKGPLGRELQLDNDEPHGNTFNWHRFFGLDESDFGPSLIMHHSGYFEGVAKLVYRMQRFDAW